MIITAETQSTQRKDFLSAGRYRQTKSTLFLEFDFWPKACEFIENRHLLSEPEASEPEADSR
jgi:hypothetical protein